MRRELDRIKEKEEREKRKPNIIISGLEIDLTKGKEAIEEWIRDELGQEKHLKIGEKKGTCGSRVQRQGGKRKDNEE